MNVILSNDPGQGEIGKVSYVVRLFGGPLHGQEHYLANLVPSITFPPPAWWKGGDPPEEIRYIFKNTGTYVFDPRDLQPTFAEPVGPFFDADTILFDNDWSPVCPTDRKRLGHVTHRAGWMCPDCRFEVSDYWLTVRLEEIEENGYRG